MTLSKHDYLAAMGIDSWQIRRASRTPNASLMIINTTADFHEDPQGQLLNAMLNAIGLDRNTVYMTGLSHGQDITQQISMVHPKVILVLDPSAANSLLNTKSPVEQLRHESHCYGPDNIPIIVTYHPNHLLQNPRDKQNAWQDLQRCYGILQQ